MFIGWAIYYNFQEDSHIYGGNTENRNPIPDIFAHYFHVIISILIFSRKWADTCIRTVRTQGLFSPPFSSASNSPCVEPPHGLMEDYWINLSLSLPSFHVEVSREYSKAVYYGRWRTFRKKLKKKKCCCSLLLTGIEFSCFPLVLVMKKVPSRRSLLLTTLYIHFASSTEGGEEKGYTPVDSDTLSWKSLASEMPSRTGCLRIFNCLRHPHHEQEAWDDKELFPPKSKESNIDWRSL